MKKLFLCICVLVFVNAGALKAQTKPDFAIYFAAPTIFHYNNTYYLCGTNGFNSDSGFYVAVSNDLLYWKKQQVIKER